MGGGGIPYLVSQCTVQYTYTIDHCVKFDIGHLSYDNIILKKFFFSFNIHIRFLSEFTSSVQIEIIELILTNSSVENCKSFMRLNLILIFCVAKLLKKGQI